MECATDLRDFIKANIHGVPIDDVMVVECKKRYGDYHRPVTRVIDEGAGRCYVPFKGFSYRLYMPGKVATLMSYKYNDTTCVFDDVTEEWPRAPVQLDHLKVPLNDFQRVMVAFVEVQSKRNDVSVAYDVLGRTLHNYYDRLYPQSHRVLGGGYIKAPTGKGKSRGIMACAGPDDVIMVRREHLEQWKYLLKSVMRVPPKLVTNLTLKKVTKCRRLFVDEAHQLTETNMRTISCIDIAEALWLVSATPTHHVEEWKVFGMGQDLILPLPSGRCMSYDMDDPNACDAEVIEETVLLEPPDSLMEAYKIMMGLSDFSESDARLLERLASVPLPVHDQIVLARNEGVVDGEVEGAASGVCALCGLDPYMPVVSSNGGTYCEMCATTPYNTSSKRKKVTGVSNLGDDPKVQAFLNKYYEDDPVRALVYVSFDSVGHALAKLLECSYVSSRSSKGMEEFKHSHRRMLVIHSRWNAGFNFNDCDAVYVLTVPRSVSVLTQMLGRVQRFDQKHRRVRLVTFAYRGMYDEFMLREPIGTDVMETRHALMWSYTQLTSIPVHGILGEAVACLCIRQDKKRSEVDLEKTHIEWGDRSFRVFC